MLRPLRSFPLLAIVLAAAIVGGLARPAAAHNTFVSSDPPDGAVVAVAPSRLSMRFTATVPLDTASAQVIDGTGARVEIASLSYGSAGDTEIVAALPTLAPGDVTVRWRLVGPDGHPLTGRIAFTIAAPASAAIPPSGPTAPAASPTPVASPSTWVSPVAAGGAADADGFSTPGAVRWLLRYGSYLAIMTLVGIVLTDELVWRGSARRPLLRRLVMRSLVIVGLLAVGQLLVLASDIGGAAPWSALGDIEAASQTDAGTALLVRVLLAACVWLVVARMQLVHADVRWSVLGLAGIALMATWAFAGHSGSQRWPHLGVPLDVAHHTAAALWIGALAIIGLSATTSLSAHELGRVVRRLSRVASLAVLVIVGTGIVQTVRLVGSPARLLEGAHGRYLAVKLVVLAAMLGLGNVNRRRMHSSFAREHEPSASALGLLRRSILVEFAFGLLILAITTALVVAPPASSNAAGAGSLPPRVDPPPAIYYSMS